MNQKQKRYHPNCKPTKRMVQISTSILSHNPKKKKYFSISIKKIKKAQFKKKKTINFNIFYQSLSLSLSLNVSFTFISWISHIQCSPLSLSLSLSLCANSFDDWIDISIVNLVGALQDFRFSIAHGFSWLASLFFVFPILFDLFWILSLQFYALIVSESVFLICVYKYVCVWIIVCMIRRVCICVCIWSESEVQEKP